MKRKTAIYIALAIMIIGILYSATHRTNLNATKDGEVFFIYGSININSRLTEDDLEVVKEILNSKFMFKENPSCGFSEQISIKLDGCKTFCIARDTCRFVYWKEKDMYIRVSKAEQQRLYSLLDKYGVFFPCV